MSNPNAATIEASINVAIAQMQSVILNPITVNVTFADMATGLGQSNTSFSDLSYSQYLTDLQQNQIISVNDAQALASLPAGPNNPANGSTDVTLTLPLLRALGEPAGANAGPDSTVSLNLAIMNLSRTGMQDPAKYDLVTVVLHELNEVLSAGGSGSVIVGAGAPATGAVGSLDLFRYSAAGTRSYTSNGSAHSYFSINGGVTNRSFFNQDSNGDYSDWSNDQAA